MGSMWAGVFAVGIVWGLGLAAPALAQQPQGEAQQNVRESAQYEQLLCTNPKFRATRIAKECGPLQGSSFYDNCVHSFDCHQGAGRAVDPKGLPASEK
ncbi:MAG TPA: hypothetical protein VGG57_07745 [Stellaceae bacterium]|jgi:hypothetical protein